MARQYQKRGRSIEAARLAADARADASRRKGEELERRRIGVQADLFGAPAVELYRPAKSTPSTWGRDLLRYNLADHVADVGVPEGPKLPRFDARAWLDRARWLASWDRWRACSKVYARFRAHARELTIVRARVLELEELAAVLPAIEATRHHPARLFLDQLGVWTPGELGALLVELRNRRQLLELGRDAPRDKGPRFDVARLPLDALERLIQRHPDLVVVDQLRAERARRFSELAQ